MPDDDLMTVSPPQPAPLEPLAEPVADETAGPARRKLSALGWVATAWLILILLVAVVGPFLIADPIVNDTGRVVERCGDGSGLPLYDPFNCVDRRAAAAQRTTGSADGKFTHLMGVDRSGADVFSQMVVGTRTSMIIAGISIAIAMLLGGALGVIAGYFRGWVDTAVGFFFDASLAFPQLILALAIVSFLGRSVPKLIMALCIVAIPLLGRIARASTLTWSEREFVTAAKALGARHGRVILREVLPNVIPALLSIAFLAVGIVIAAEGALALIGLGVPAGQVSWGLVLATGGTDLRGLPHMVFIPSAAIVLTVMALNLLGDAIRQKFDVRESAL